MLKFFVNPNTNVVHIGSNGDFVEPRHGKNFTYCGRYIFDLMKCAPSQIFIEGFRICERCNNLKGTP